MAAELSFPPEFAGFFNGLRRGRVSFPRCEDCGRFHWYPMKQCPHCLSHAIRWEAVDGAAELYSWTVVRHAFDAGFHGTLPYVIGLVTFGAAPGVRLITNIVDADTATLHIGQRLEPVFFEASEANPLVFFRPLAAA